MTTTTGTDWIQVGADAVRYQGGRVSASVLFGTIVRMGKRDVVVRFENGETERWSIKNQVNSKGLPVISALSRSEGDTWTPNVLLLHPCDLRISESRAANARAERIYQIDRAYDAFRRAVRSDDTSWGTEEQAALRKQLDAWTRMEQGEAANGQIALGDRDATDG